MQETPNQKLKKTGEALQVVSGTTVAQKQNLEARQRSPLRNFRLRAWECSGLTEYRIWAQVAARDGRLRVFASGSRAQFGRS